MYGVKFRKNFFAGASALACIFFASSGLCAAEGQADKSRRRDAPWVSLAHQRKLEAQANGTYVEPEEEAPAGGGLVSKISRGSAPKLSADKFDYGTEEGDADKLVASGNAAIVDKHFEVHSDTLEYSQKDGYANLKGNVVASADGSRIVTDDARVNMAEDSMKSGYIRFGKAPVFVEGDKFDADKTKVKIENAKVYFGEPDWLTMSASGSEVRYDSDTDLLEIDDVTLWLGPVPFFYVPYYSQHGLDKPPFDAQFGAGMNDDYGFYVRSTMMYNGLKDVSLGMLLDYYTKRSVLFGPAMEYDYAGMETALKGFLQGAYINDHGSPEVLGYDSLGRRISGNDRFFIEWRHNQIIADRIGLTGNLSWWSDDAVTRDFRPEFFYDNQTPDNFGEAIYYGNYFTTSVFTRFAPNDWEAVQQRLPEVRVDLQPVEIFKTGIYQNAFASYAYMSDLNKFEHAGRITSNRADAYYGLTRPIQLSDWSKITPVLGGRVTYYGDAQGKSGDYTRFLGQVGFDAQMDIWGTFDVKMETMGIDGIRHHMIPQISYRYIHDATQGSDRMPVIDEFYYTTYPPILDLGVMRNVDQMVKTNTMRFGLQNIFETRDEEWGSREIARFDLYQDVNFDPRPLRQADGDRSFSDLYINASVSPARWLTIGSYVRANLDYVDIPEVNGYIGLLDGDECSVYFVSTYMRGMLTQYSLYADYRISERFKVYGNWHYDYKLSKLTEQAYALSHRLSNSWVVDYIISNRSGASRQNNFSFSVRLNMFIF